MPIFVQWKWIERTKTFLVIFHFYDDYSKPNLRFKKMTFSGSEQDGCVIYLPLDDVLDQSSDLLESMRIRPAMTWAPSHVEIGLLSELLGYANIISGLSETIKRRLRRKLEILYDLSDKTVEYLDFPYKQKEYREILINQIDGLKQHSDKLCLLGQRIAKDGKIEGVFCAELCHEYIDYLKRLLKPHLRD